MSWYFFGGFSAYWIVPSGRWRNHSGCSVDVRDDPASTGTRCPARSRCPRARAAATRRRKSSQRAELRDGSPCARLRPRRSPRGCPTSSGPGRERVVAALAVLAADRDGSAAGRARRSPCRATYGRRASTIAKRAVRARLDAAERGNSSYQVLKRARSRSTTSASIALGRSGQARGRDGASRARRALRRSAERAQRVQVRSARSAVAPPGRSSARRVPSARASRRRVDRARRRPARRRGCRRRRRGARNRARQDRKWSTQAITRVLVAADAIDREVRRASGRCRAAPSASRASGLVVVAPAQHHARAVVAVGEAVGLDLDRLRRPRA